MLYYITMQYTILFHVVCDVFYNVMFSILCNTVFQHSGLH